MDKDQREGSRSNLIRRPSGSPPPLAVVDTRRKVEIQERRAMRRTAPMAAVAMLVSTFLACGFLALGKMGHLVAASDYMAGFESFSLRALILYGLLPLVTASLMLAIYRPPLWLVAGTRPPLTVLFAAPAAGFLAGWLIWCVVQLALSFVPSWSNWLAIPLIWQAGSQYLGRAPLFLVLTFMVAVVLPATSHEFLHRGVIMPVFTAKDLPFYRNILPALLAAAISFDLAGLAVAVLLSLLAAWARTASGSLLASSLLSAGLGAAMLLAQPLFGLLSETILKMPLIDPLRVRVFLVTMILILLVLLLAPL
ncbi:MAG: hypothetical protein GX838_00045, partial [Clostridiaceae bacterium]|nr:hypothetical protein [Clostridiaceae bacterium]